MSSAVQQVCELLGAALKHADYGKVVQLVGELSGMLKERSQTASLIDETRHDLLLRLVEELPQVDFEGRKDIVALVSLVSKLQVGGSSSSRSKEAGGLKDSSVISKQLISRLAKRYAEVPDLSLNYGILLREFCRCPGISRHALESRVLYDLFLIARRGENFDLASDAFLSIKDILTRQKSLGASWILANFEEFFQKYHEILLAESDQRAAEEDLYICQRQSLKLLSDMLLDRTFMQIMLRYINSDEYLKVHMQFLRSSSKTIQFEAFHVFKIFAANPNKKPRVTRILYQNRLKLVDFLGTFLVPERNSDQQFLQDKMTVIQKLKALQLPDDTTTPSGAASNAGTSQASTNGGAASNAGTESTTQASTTG
ncbi:unnamed protein product [Amoebophrya sp. A25]|nr:unnamed protein product [Amoebophrya sp. A25]|eukprot:GSA25T00012759001.1